MEHLSFQAPDEASAWCAKCKAHTSEGSRSITSTEPGTGLTRRTNVSVCKECGSAFMMYVPRDVFGAPMLSFKCSAVLGLLIAFCLIGANYHQPSNIDGLRFVVASVLAFFLVIALGSTAWFTYWCSLWRNWVKSQN